MGFRYCALPTLIRLWSERATTISNTARKVLCIDRFGEPESNPGGRVVQYTEIFIFTFTFCVQYVTKGSTKSSTFVNSLFSFKNSSHLVCDYLVSLISEELTHSDMGFISFCRLSKI